MEKQQKTQQKKKVKIREVVFLNEFKLEDYFIKQANIIASKIK